MKIERINGGSLYQPVFTRRCSRCKEPHTMLGGKVNRHRKFICRFCLGAEASA